MFSYVRAVILLLACLPALAEVGNVRLTVKDWAGVARNGEIVTSGIPLPESAGVTDAANLMVTDESGAVIDSQMTVLARWGGAPGDGTKPIKWVLVEFPATVAAGESATYYLKDRSGPDPGSLSLSVTEDATFVTIDTGTATFKIRKDYFNFLDTVIAGGTTVVSSGSGQKLAVVAGGTEYNSVTGDPSFSLSVEKSGPLRAQIKASGKLTAPGGSQALSYTMRLYFWVGSSAVRTYTTIVWDQDSTTFKPSNLYLSLPLQLGDSLTFTSPLGSGAMAPEDSAYHLQEDFNSAYLRKNGSTVAVGTQPLGWFDLSDGANGVTVFRKYMWQEYPGELEASGKTLIAHFWPAHADLAALVTNKRTEANASTVINHVFPYQESNLMDLTVRSEPYAADSVHNAFGTAKTWEIAYEFHSSGAASAAVRAAARFDKPLMAVNPEWFGSSGALGKLGPAIASGEVNVNGLYRYEKKLDEAFDAFQTVNERRRNFGLMVYGDHQYDNGSVTARYWLMMRRNWNQGFWVQWIRTGDWKYFECATAQNRHIMDVDTQHADFDGTLGGQTLHKRKGGFPGTHEVGAAHWNNLAAGTPGAANYEPFVDSADEGWLTYYYLTGYDRALEVSKERWDRLVSAGLETYAASTGARPISNALGASSRAYMATGDDKYLNYANEAWYYIHKNIREPVIGYLNNSGMFNWNIFTSAWAIDHLLDYYRVSNNPDVLEMYIRLTKAMAGMGKMADTSGVRDYAGAQIRALAECYYLTGDATYLQYAKYWLTGYFGEPREFTKTSGSGAFSNATFHDASVFFFTAPYAIKALEDYGFSNVGFPGIPSSYALIPSDGTNKLTYYVHEAADQPFTVGFFLEPDIGFFTAWQASGDFYVSVYDPDGNAVETTRTPDNVSATTHTFTQPNTMAAIIQGGADNRIRRFAVPADGKTGYYRIEITASKANHVAAIESSSLGNIVLNLAAGSSGNSLGMGLYRIWAPAGTTGFQVSGNVFTFLMDGEGNIYNTHTSSGTPITYNTANKANMWWTLGTRFFANAWGGTVSHRISKIKALVSASAATWADAPVSADESELSGSVIRIVNSGDAPGAPTLSAVPASLGFNAAGGTNPPNQTFSTDCEGSACTVSATESCNWLAVTPEGGSTPSVFTVSVDIGGLGAGNYYCPITLSSPEAGNSPRSVAVNLTVEPILAGQRTRLRGRSRLAGEARIR